MANLEGEVEESHDDRDTADEIAEVSEVFERHDPCRLADQRSAAPRALTANATAPEPHRQTISPFVTAQPAVSAAARC